MMCLKASAVSEHVNGMMKLCYGIAMGVMPYRVGLVCLAMEVWNAPRSLALYDLG